MSNEQLNFNLNSNIGQATKDSTQFASALDKAKSGVDTLNEQLTIQNQVIKDLEKSAFELEKKLIDTPKTAMGFSELDKALKHTKLEIKAEKDALKELNDEMKVAQSEFEKASKEQDDLAKNSKKAGGALGVLRGGVKAVGVAFKALGIGLIIAAFAALKEAIGRNQKAMDLINSIVGAVAQTFNQVASVIADTVSWVSQSSERFDGLGKVLGGIGKMILTPFQLAWEGIKLGVFGAQLAWEKSFFGSGDAGKIKSLTKSIKDTKAEIKDIGERFVESGKLVVDNFGEAINEVGAIVDHASEGLSKISVKANFESAKAITEQKNAAALAAVEIQGLIEKYDREAELLRQTRDDTTKSMDERIAANKELGTVLDDQEKAMLRQADIRIQAAQAELNANKGNLEAQIALKEAINERAGIEAQIAGMRSEQLTNINSLEEEKRAIEQENFERKQEEEQVLMDLMNENLLASIDNLHERALKELEIQKQKELDSLSSHENFKQLKEQIDIKYDKKEAKLNKKKREADQKMDKLAMKQKADLAVQAFDNLSSVLGKESKAGKAAAAASATISALQGATSAFASLAPIPFVGPVLGGIAAAAALVAGYANVKEIYATPGPDGSTGGGGTGGGGNTPDLESAAEQAGATGNVAPQMVGGAFELGQAAEPEAAKAYVVTDEVTDGQDQLEDIRRRSSV